MSLTQMSTLNDYYHAVNAVSPTFGGIFHNYTVATPQFVNVAWVATAKLISAVTSIIFYTAFVIITFGQVESYRERFKASLKEIALEGKLLLAGIVGAIFPWLIASIHGEKAKKVLDDMAVLDYVNPLLPNLRFVRDTSLALRERTASPDYKRELDAFALEVGRNFATAVGSFVPRLDQ